jgi:2-hydroxychromene-2-carboxylate isomerase
MPHLDFWYDFASPYSYPAAMRVADDAAGLGVDVRWRPFVLGPIFAGKGLTTSPMVADPVKGAYAWRDLTRICARLGLPFRAPPGFPQNGVLASRVALVLDEAARPTFSRAVYSAQFGEGAVISDAEVIAGVLTALGHDAESVLASALDATNKPLLRGQTEAAEAAGLFGAPSFIADDGELFWGNDRLADALAWAAGERLPQR